MLSNVGDNCPVCCRTTFYLSLICLVTLVNRICFAENIPQIQVSHPQLQGPYRQLHILRVPRPLLQSGFRLVLGSPAKGFQTRMPLSKFMNPGVGGYSGRAIAGINGTFLTEFGSYTATPRGPLVYDGELLLLSTVLPPHPVLFVHDSGSLALGAVRLSLVLSREGSSDIPLGLNTHQTKSHGILLTAGAVGKNTGAEFSIPENPDGTVYLLRPVDSSQESLHFSADVFRQSIEKSFTVLPTSSRYSGEVPAGHLALLFWESLPEDDLRDRELVKLTFQTEVLEELQHGSCYDGPGADASTIRFATGVGKVYLETRAGKAVIPEYIRSIEEQRNPRSALCWSDKEIVFLTVDGVRPGLHRITSFLTNRKRSAGMTGLEIAAYMKDVLRCSCGVELDGGKTATLWYDGKVINTPAAGIEFGTNYPLLVIGPE